MIDTATTVETSRTPRLRNIVPVTPADRLNAPSSIDHGRPSPGRDR
jgi:hypothetical protein